MARAIHMHSQRHRSVVHDRGASPGNGPETANHIVVVDDDPLLVQMMITNYLEASGFSVKATPNHAEVLQVREVDQCLIVLDPKPRQGDVFNVLQDIRASSDVPVIIISGHRAAEIDRIKGLELGADDYVVKPFSLRELLARIRAVLRGRQMGRVARARVPQRGGYRFGGWRLERRGRRLINPDGVPVLLTRREFNLLLALLEAPGQPLSREHLLRATHIREDALDRSIDVQVMRLRKKLVVDPSLPDVIRTERGFGYRFALPVEPL